MNSMHYVMQSTKFPGQQYEIIKLIGQGAESEVYEGKNQVTQQKVALKKYKKGIRVSEVRMLQDFQGQFLIHLMMVKDIIYDGQSICAIVMDLADGNLNSYMEASEEFKRMNTKEKNKLFLQIVQGVVELHNKNLFHRDLKPSNIVYLDRNPVILKICDFGFVKEMVDQRLHTENVGTRIYQPSEQISNTYDSSVDIWALGVIWCEMLGAKHTSLHKILEQTKVNDFVRREVQNILNNQELDILMKMLIIDPKQRIKAAQIESSLKQLLGMNPLMLSTRLPTPLTFQIQPPTFRISTPLPQANPIIQNNINPLLTLENYAKQDELIPKFILDSCYQKIQQSESDQNIKKVYSCLQMNIGQIIQKYEKYEDNLKSANQFNWPEQQVKNKEFFKEFNQISLEGQKCLDFLKNELLVQQSLSEPKTNGRKQRRKQTLETLNLIKKQLETDFQKLKEIINQFEENQQNKQLNQSFSNFQTRVSNHRDKMRQLEKLGHNLCHEHNHMEKSTQLKKLKEICDQYSNQQISDLDTLTNDLKLNLTKILETETYKAQIQLYHLERLISRLGPLDSECQKLNGEVVKYKTLIVDSKKISNEMNALAKQNKKIIDDSKNIEKYTSVLLNKITEINQEIYATYVNKEYLKTFLEDYFLEIRKVQLLR